MQKLILASTSKYRQALLKQVGIAFEALAPNVDEEQLQNTYTGDNNDLSTFLAKAKAESIAKDHGDVIVIGSDQVALFNGIVLYKPNTADDVRERLKLLQGNTHQLSTALCVIDGDEVTSTCVVSTLKMHPLSDDEIDRYIEIDQPMGCAGGYKIEQKGAALFESVSSDDYNSIIGLPILSLVSILRKKGKFRL